MEQVDIVDSNGNVLFQTSKEEAHKKGLLHKTVVGEVFDSKGRWLLVKQAAHKQDPARFVNAVGGHIRSKEDHIDALFREAYEELGYREFVHKYIGHVVYNRKVGDTHENHFFVVYEIYSDVKPALGNESTDFNYFVEDELKKVLHESPHLFGDAFDVVAKTFYSHLFEKDLKL